MQSQTNPSNPKNDSESQATARKNQSINNYLSQISPELFINRNAHPEIQRHQKCPEETKSHSPHQSIFNSKKIHAMKECAGHEERKAIGPEILRQFIGILFGTVHFRLKPLFRKVNHAPATRSMAGKPAKKTLESDSEALTIQKSPQNHVRRKTRLRSSFEEN